MTKRAKRPVYWLIGGTLIGILLGFGASLGVEAYLEWMRNAKPPQAKLQLQELAEAVESHLEQSDSLPSCGPVPDAPPADSSAASWPDSHCFQALGWNPQYPPAASYRLVPLHGHRFLVTATVETEQGGQVFILVGGDDFVGVLDGGRSAEKVRILR